MDHQPASAAGRRLRVGYVSGDFRQHAVTHFFEPLLSHHDRDRVEVWAYTTNGQQDEVTTRLRGLVDHWQSIVGLSDEAAAERIRGDALDVLVDLSNHTEHNRLGVFAQRAAPVQVEFLGHFSTTGVAEIDYWIGDPEQTPPSFDAYYSETVWRLAHVAHAYSGSEAAPAPDWRSLEDGTVWLGCFHNPVKLTPRTLALWARVLHALPQAKLLLKAKQLANAERREQLANEFAAHGIGVERLAFRDHTASPDWAAHMRAYAIIDIALDPIGPWRGAATNCDALWMGVPVVTLRGARAGSRQTAALLQALGRAEWIVDDEDAYVDTVVQLASDVDGRRTIRFTQREQMRGSPLCDATGLARALEHAYEAMFQRWCDERGAQEHSQSRSCGPVWLSAPTASSELKAPPVSEGARPVYLIHALARSGGTLVSRCLGAMTGVYLFSEVHPQAAAAAQQFGGADQFSLAHQAREWYRLLDDGKAGQRAAPPAYLDQVDEIAARVTEHDGQLVLRDWSHLDFHAVPFLPAATHHSAHAEQLAKRFVLHRISLVRHPIFQWLSLQRLTVIRGRLTLAEFMAGYLAFARLAVETGFVRLEDFVCNPDTSLRALCDQLHLPFDPGYHERWPDNRWVTGDFTSASMTPKEILYRPKMIGADVLAQFDVLPEYHEALKLLGYRSPQVGQLQEAGDLVESKAPAEAGVCQRLEPLWIEEKRDGGYQLGHCDRGETARGAEPAPPDICILVVTYQHGSFIRQCLESLVNQTLRPNKIKVFDDYSVDSTWEIVQEFKTNYPDMFELHRNSKNLGLRQQGLRIWSEVSGNYCAFIEGDDFWAPEKLEGEFRSLHSSTSAGAAYSNVAVTDEQGRIMGRWHEPSEGTLPGGYLFARVASRTIFNRSGNMFRNYLFRTRCYFRLAHKTDTRIPSMGDYDFNLLFSYHYPFVPSSQLEPMVFYRRHRQGVSNQRRDVVLSSMMIYEKHRAKFEQMSAADRLLTCLHQERNLAMGRQYLPNKKQKEYAPEAIIARALRQIDELPKETALSVQVRANPLIAELITYCCAELELRGNQDLAKVLKYTSGNSLT